MAQKTRYVYVTWHYTKHGIAYLKHVLSAFWKHGLSKSVQFSDLEQIELMGVFDEPKSKKVKKFIFDEVIYLTAPQETFDALESRRFFYKKSILQDNLIKDNGLLPIFEDIRSEDDEHCKTICYHLEQEKEYIKQKYPDLYDAFLNCIWRDIHHYSIKSQIQWLLQETNFTKVYKSHQFREVELPIKNLHDEQEIFDKLSKWIQKNMLNDVNTEYIINITLGSPETQTVWYLLSELNKLPARHRFIKTYDDKKAERKERFKPFNVRETPTKILSEVKKFSIIENTRSEKRELINELFDVFFRTEFRILIMGERGLGKSRLIKEFAEKHKIRPFIEANGASFADDTMAESELFGYERGTFTGGLKDGKKGLLLEANGGVFFLDEVHHLSKTVQSKLLKSLQTDEYGYMYVRRLGSNKEEPLKCKIIFATNKSVEELKQLLLPDFYDRITQHILRIPSLRETPEDREKDWENVWKQIGFEKEYPCPKNIELLQWLKGLELPGNYRDLQKIALYYKTYLSFGKEITEHLKAKSAFEYAKQQYEHFHTDYHQNTGYNFIYGKTAREMQDEYLYHLREWAIKIYGSRQKASEILQVDEKTLNNWRKNYKKN